MNWNQNGGNWAELKRQAKRRDSEPENQYLQTANSQDFCGKRQLNEVLEPNNSKAEVQLSELHDLLKIMGNIHSEINNSFYK